MRSLRVSQIVLFVLASIVEVRVRASDVLNLPESTRPIEVPENCIIESSICTIKAAKGSKFSLQMDENEVVLSSESTFGRFSGTSGSLINGRALISVVSSFRLESPYGAVTSESAHFLADFSNNKLSIRVLKGSVHIEARGQENKIALNAGYENWISRIDTKGQTTVGIPRAFNPQKTMTDFANLHNGSKREFSSQAEEMKLVWQDAVRESALIHETVVRRELASQAEKKRLKDIADKNWQDERDELRALLMKKTFE